MDCRVGGIIFSSNFDSGNLARVEKVSYDTDERSSSVTTSNKPHSQKGNANTNNSIFGNTSIADIRVDHEFKIWTKPDCAGTIYENGNRTWFYFSVRGYSPGKVMKFTVMNMNKQSKIYSQGYAPLYRVRNSSVAQSRWQRIRDRPLWEIVNGQFLLTFVHRFLDPRGSITYFAFCYPWTYNEMQLQLSKLDVIFHYNKVDTDKENLILHKCNEGNEVKNDKFDGIGNNVVIPELVTSSTVNTTAAITGEIADVTTLSATSSSSSSSTSSEDEKFCQSEKGLFDKIYFYRELLCYSLEGRRIELLTITDWSGCTYVEEDRFDPLLFPEINKNRSWKFTNKKVVLVSARVHPGETPSSHVFNGILEFLLRLNDQRACELRKNFIFKLIPMLNPDGVFHGHYRTDTLGINLNRVYLKPDFLYYPSIYATKALITYYHTNYGTIKPYAEFLDDIFKRKVPTDTSGILVAPPSAYSPSSSSPSISSNSVPTSKTTENDPNSVGTTSSDVSNSMQATVEKANSDKLFKNVIQNPVTFANNSEDGPNTTVEEEEESKEKSISKFGLNDSVKSYTTLDEPIKNSQSSFSEQTLKSLLSTTILLSKTPPITKGGTTLNQKENHSSSNSSSTSPSIGQLLLNSDLPLINEGVSVIHKINYSVNGAATDDIDEDDNNDVTDTVTGQSNNDRENMPNCQHINTKTSNSSLKRLLRINNSKLTSTPSYLAELNKDLSKTFTNYLKPVQFPLVCNTEVGSQRNPAATTMITTTTTTTTLPSSSFTSTTRTTPSTTNNLTPSVKRLITSAPNNILIKRTIGDGKKSKKSYKDYKSNGFKGSGRNQPNRILSFFNRGGKRYPALKVDCLPCFFMKWNSPYRQAITNGQISNSSLQQQKKEPNDVLLNSNIMPVLNRDTTTNYKSKKSLVHQKSQLVSEQIKEKSLICLNDNTKISNDDIQMISYGDIINASFSLVTQECIHKNNKNGNDYMNEQKNTLLNPETHLLYSNEEEILNETALHTLNDDSCCLSTVGNEGSDMDDEENVHLLNNFNEKSDVEDFSINPQFLHVLESIETLVKNEKNLNKIQLSSDTSTSESGNDLNMNEFDRIEMLKEQLNQLRKADHLCDASLIQNEESNVAFYFDLHGHCSKRGCFLYGNWLDTEENMVDNVLYALLVGVNSIYFDFDSCNFTLRNMYQKDRKGNFTKEGAGRVAVWKHMGLTHCYTVECNYNAGPLPSRLSRFIASSLPNDSGRFTPTGAFYGPHWSNLVDIGSMQSWNCGISTQMNTMHTIYSNHTNQTSSGAPRFTPAHYEDVGRALMIAILDMKQINPWPKIASLGGANAEPGVGILTLPTSLLEFSNFTNLKEWAKKYIKAMAPSNMSLKVYTNRCTEDSASKLSDTNKSQINMKTIPPSESSEGVKNPLSLTNKSTQNSLSTMQSHENSSTVIHSNTSKKVSISKTTISQTTSDIYGNVTLLDKNCTNRRNTSPKLNRKHHLYRLNPVISHFSARNKQQHRKFSTTKETSDVLEVLSQSCSRPSSATTEDTKTWPATVFNSHSEERNLKTLKNEDSSSEFDRYNNTKACYFYDCNCEKSSKVIHKDLTEPSFKNKIKEEGEIKNKKCVLKKKSSLYHTKKRPTYLSTNNQIASDEISDNKKLNKTQSFNVNCSSSILEKYTNSSYEVEGTVNTTTPYVSNEQSSNLFTNIPLKICDSSEDSVTTKHIYMNPVDKKQTQSSDKMKSEAIEHKSAKAQYKDKMKYAYLRKVGRTDACNGFSYTKPGYTKLLKHYTNIHRSDHRNTSIKTSSANNNSNNNNNNHKTPKLNNNRTCDFNTYNALRHRKSRLNKLKSSKKRPCLENITLNDDRNSNNDICTMQKLTISDQSNLCEYKNNRRSSSTTGNHDVFNNIDNTSQNYADNTTSIIHTTEENTLAPPVIRSNSLRDLLNTSESEDCIKELKELFKSVSLN